MSRTQPNIIITGTPGVGKSIHGEQLAANTGLKHLSINQSVKDRDCHHGWSEEHKSWIVDEDKVCKSALIIAPKLTGMAALRFSRRRGTSRRLYNRLARMRSLPPKLDRLGCGIADGLYENL